MPAKFQLTQHARDFELLRKFCSFFGCGSSALRPNEQIGDSIVSKLSDLDKNIIPFFKEHPIQGEKSKDFADFCKVFDIMKANKHSTISGLSEIRDIKAGMNKGRK
jgi:hypothetical protein